MHNDVPNNLRKVAFVMLGMLVLLLIYISYLQIFEGNYLAAHPLNRRSIETSKNIMRGQILDKNGVKIAYSEPNKQGEYVREYPYGAIFSHVVGYDSPQYGKTGLEGTYNGQLSGLVNPERGLGAITQLWQKPGGNNILLTIDSKLQETAYRALGNNRGAIVAIDTRTGAILAMVSKPDFNPNRIDKEWQSVSSAMDSPLINRAVQGLYPPGSIIKVMIAEASLQEKIVDTKKTFECQGKLKIGPDYVLPEANFKAHGKVDLEEALAVSCNVTFGLISLELGRGKLAKTFERYGFSRSVPEEIEEAASRLPNFDKLSDGDIAQTGIGQGSLLVTPLRMAMLASVFANNGKIMTPYLVQQVTAPNGEVIKQHSASEWLNPVNAANAGLVRDMMVNVVDNGTGIAAKISGLKVAGKTGTAENPNGAPHAWFIGFAPANQPKIAIAVIVENGGSGGAIAAPIARQLFSQALL